jgi:hypothetical protein
MLMRNVLLATVCAVPLMLLGTGPASAIDLNVGVGVGVDPYPYDDDDYDSDYDRRRGRLKCWEAKQLVRDRGYYAVVTLDCGGRIYRFRAKRKGKVYILAVNPRTYAVWRD